MWRIFPCRVLVLRDHELAMRVALGAGRGRILQQLITENLLLALLGGAAGLALAAWGLDGLTSYAAAFLPRADEIKISAPVLIFTALVSLGTGLIFGSWPRLPGSGALFGTLKDGARAGGTHGGRLRGLLIVGQVAVSVPLLVGAALAARSLLQLQQVDPGVETNRVLAANLSLNFTKYNNFEQRLGFWDRSVNEVERMPGVESVAVSGTVPLNGLANHPTTFAIEHQVTQTNSPSPAANVLISSENYFKTVGEPLLRGRAFNSGDTREAPPVVIINQSLASRLWPKEDPVGRRITFDDGQHWNTIVGVVANARQQIDAQPVDEIYLPLRARECVDRRGVDGAHARRASWPNECIARSHSPRRSATAHHLDRDARRSADALARFTETDRESSRSLRPARARHYRCRNWRRARVFG